MRCCYDRRQRTEASRRDAVAADGDHVDEDSSDGGRDYDDDDDDDNVE